MELYNAEMLRWPLSYVTDSRQHGTGWAVIHAPVVSPSRYEQFAVLRRAGFRFIGMTSDGTFPRDTGAESLDYGAICEAWCHCFREPDRYLPRDAPRALISHSDFTDSRRVAAEAEAAQYGDERPADFVFVGATEPWKQQAKNWPLAQRAIPRLCDALGLRALVVGAPPDLSSSSVTCTPSLPWRELLRRIARARFLFVPSIDDASPRVLTEALALDVPVVVYRGILGGWKYVNAFTGAFFDGEHDVVDVVRTCMERTLKPRRWFEANFGPYHAGKRLLDLIRVLDPSIEERSFLGLSDRLQDDPERDAITFTTNRASPSIGEQ